MTLYRQPDISESTIERYLNALYAKYPVSNVNITVDEPLDWEMEVMPDGTGWAQLLTRIQILRGNRGAGKKQYYFGLLAPAKSFDEFCVLSCMAGLSVFAEKPGDTWARASIGLGFGNEMSITTMVHELGHAHGRKHAPCGPDVYGIDPDFPTPEAQVEHWGYDMHSRRLIKPNSTKDFMSYCEPAWVSDYTYNALFERVSQLNELPDVQPPPLPGERQSWVSINVGMDGELTVGPEMPLDQTPRGEEVSLELLDGHGDVVGESVGYFHPYTHIAGGLVLFPNPEDWVINVRLFEDTVKIRRSL